MWVLHFGTKLICPHKSLPAVFSMLLHKLVISNAIQPVVTVCYDGQSLVYCNNAALLLVCFACDAWPSVLHMASIDLVTCCVILLTD